jgi:hypothetical protein
MLIPDKNMTMLCPWGQGGWPINPLIHRGQQKIIFDTSIVE